MKDLSQLLLAEQKKASRKPAFRLTISPFIKPGHSAVVQWSMFGWQKIHGDSTVVGPHGLAIPQDCSINRVRANGFTGYHQRVAAPGFNSDWTEWTELGTIPGGIISISAGLQGPEVMIIGYTGGYLSFRRSTDNGQSFGEWTAIGTNVADAFAAACHKDAAEMAVVFGEASSHALQIILRNGSLAWTTASTLPGSPYIVTASVFFDGDYNIIALVNRNNIYSLARVVFGQGYRVAANTWSDVVYLNLASASVDSLDLSNQYVQHLPPNSDFLAARNEYDLRTFNPAGMKYKDIRAWVDAHPGAIPGSINAFIREKYFGQGHWDTVDAISLARATDNLDLDAPFTCKPPGQPPLLTFIRINERWTYRLRPGTDFYDADWSQAHRQGQGTPFGLALASDGTYIWGTRANEVWRMAMPGVLQIPPSGWQGQELTPVEIPWTDVLKVQETIKPEDASELYIELDNAAKAYYHGWGVSIERGFLVRLKYGYAGKGQDLLSPGQVYFIEDICYSGAPGRSTVTLHCIDMWGLLQRFILPAPAEINLAGHQHTAYDIAEKLVQCVGGTLGYRSRSSAITSLYPRMTLRAGESAAGILKRLLYIVPDVIIFDGLTAWIINPLELDPASYCLHFPRRKLS